MTASTPRIRHSTLVVSRAGEPAIAQVAAVAIATSSDATATRARAGGGEWPAAAALPRPNGRLGHASEQLLAAGDAEDLGRFRVGDRRQAPQRIDRATSTHALVLR